MKANIKYLILIIVVIPMTAVLLAPETRTKPVQAQVNLPGVDRPGFVPIECPANMLRGYAIECGMVTVPENHANPDGPTIKLAVAIVHSTSPNLAPDPLLFIAGGPGGRALDNVSFWLEYLHPLLARRDVVFFDQRGTGRSEPAMECLEIDIGVTDPLEAYGLVGAITACRDRLTDAGIDLSAYNSAQNAGDIAVLREALGYEEWNLYGVSYGSRVALTVLRDHSQGVRSAILDARTPVDADSLLEDPAHARSAFQKLFATCQTELVCQTAYPDLDQVNADTTNDLAANPVALEIANSITGESRTEALDGVEFYATLLGMLGSSRRTLWRTSATVAATWRCCGEGRCSFVAHRPSLWRERVARCGRSWARMGSVPTTVCSSSRCSSCRTVRSTACWASPTPAIKQLPSSRISRMVISG